LPPKTAGRDYNIRFDYFTAFRLHNIIRLLIKCLNSTEIRNVFCGMRISQYSTVKGYNRFSNRKIDYNNPELED